MNFAKEKDAFCFHNNLCRICRGADDNLMKCSQCKAVAYCSKVHQKNDWKFHKGFCKAMANALKESPHVENSNMDDLLMLRKLRHQNIEKELGRKLEEEEVIMCMHLRYCEVCLSENVHLECTDCKNAFFCSELHRDSFKELHNIHCQELKLSREIYMWIDKQETLGDDSIIVSEISKDIQSLPTSFLDLLKLYDKSMMNSNFIDAKNVSKLHYLYPVASILYGLEKCGDLKNRMFHNHELIIHIVGGDICELSYDWNNMFELLFHWIDNLTSVEYIIVGPDLKYNTTTERHSKELCINCKSKNVTTKRSFYGDLYHNRVTNLIKPDVVVCFNSGIHVPEYDWKKSIKCLVDDHFPLILTAYTLGEITADIECIKKICKDEVQILVQPQVNPFHEGKPLRYTSQVEPIFYHSGYISVLKK